jgi:hypothetical protein
MHHLAKGIERHTAMPAGSVTEAVRRESLVYLCIHFFSLPRESRNFAARIFLYALGKRRVHFFVGTLILFNDHGKSDAFTWSCVSHCQTAVEKLLKACEIV